MGCEKLREIMLKKIPRRYSCLLCSKDGLLWWNWDCCCTVLVKGISFFLLHSFLTPWALLEALLSLTDTAKTNKTRHENSTNNLTFLMVSVWNWDWHQWSSKIGGGLMPLSALKCFQVWTTPKNVTFLMPLLPSLFYSWFDLKSSKRRSTSVCVSKNILVEYIILCSFMKRFQQIPVRVSNFEQLKSTLTQDDKDSFACPEKGKCR